MWVYVSGVGVFDEDQGVHPEYLLLEDKPMNSPKNNEEIGKYGQATISSARTCLGQTNQLRASNCLDLLVLTTCNL